MNLIVETTETDLRSALDAAAIVGVSTSMVIRASTDIVSDLVVFGVTLAAQVPLGLIVNWLYDQMIQRKRGKYDVHITHVVHEGTQINISIHLDAQDIEYNVPQKE